MSRSPHVLVNGSTRGIGKAIVDALTSHGARVISHGRKDAANTVGADLADAPAADSLWDKALDRLDGRIDVLINNAGIFESVSPDEPLDVWQDAWRQTLQINLQASADLCRRAIQHFQQRADGGRIINVASRAAYRVDSPLHWHYAASKAGMIGMTKSIARGYAAQNILAFSICPGFVMTEMAGDSLSGPDGPKLLAEIPLGRVAEAG